MNRNFNLRLKQLEEKQAEREPIRLRLVFGDELTPGERAEPDKLIVLHWSKDEPIRLILDA